MVSVTQQNKNLNVRDFVRLSWRYKWFVIGLTAVFAVVSVYVALSIPNQYKAEVLLAPSDEQQGGGLAALANKFGGLASLAGINLPGKGSDKSLIALEIFRSRQFLMGFIERHDALIPLMAGKEWDPQTKQLILNEKTYDSETKTWVRDVSFPLQPKPTLFEAYEELSKRVTMDRESKSGSVKVSLEFFSPILAQKWLTLLVADFNQFMREQELKESVKSIEYLKKQIETTHIAELRNLFFQMVQEQTQKTMLAEVREEFMYKTLDVAIVPEIKSKPFRAIIVLFFTAFGGILSLFIVHLRQAVISKRPDTISQQ